MEPAEIFLNHYDMLGESEPVFRPISPPHERPMFSVAIYRGVPEKDALLGFTIGLSLTHPPGGPPGIHKELMIAMRTTDEAWSLAAAFIAYQLRDTCPFECGDTINFVENISTESEMNAFVIIHPILLKPRLRGRARLIRYADDFVICFQREDDARRVAEVLPKRFAKYGLTLDPDKTRLFQYRKPGSGDQGDPPTFDFLGFTHYWARSLTGKWVIKRKTIWKRLARKAHEIWQWCRQHRHEPLEWQQERLTSRLLGYSTTSGSSVIYSRLRNSFVQCELDGATG